MENNRFLGSISSSSFKNLFPRSASSRPKMMMKSTPTMLNPNSENVPPIDPNIQASGPLLSPSKNTPSKYTMIPQESTRSVVELDVSAPQNPPVKVMVRIRPSLSAKTGDCSVKKVSEDSVSIGDRKFSFDSVFDTSSTQEDLFQKVGVPLVNDALAGYNTSVLTYGQTGSGKTYTMWGPPSAMVEGPSATAHRQGIVPRIFELLFTKIQQDKDNSEGRQINYQCRCSFFEIYNGQIGDLLDATQRNLEIKEDAKYGVFVENLTEEYVTSYEDVTQMLIKGLSSRKVGTTSTNSKSSRSHIVFTCMIESWCKETSSKCFGSSKTSRINLVDLAGFEKNVLDVVNNKQSLKEGKFVKKSTSQLGNLINTLANNTNHLEISKDMTYGSSILTKFLKESFGGNSKLSVICAVFPDNKFSNETASTLRFGKQVKLVQNKPVINEITEDHVNDLSDQIRQLKEELLRAKSSVSNSTETCPTYSNTRSVRESLNQLRLGLNRSLILPNINRDSFVDVHSTENDFKELSLQLRKLHSDEDSEDDDVELVSEKYVSCSEESETDEPNLMGTLRSSINSRRESEVFQEPILSESPKIKNNTNRKSLAIISEQDDDAPEISKCVPSDVIKQQQLDDDEHVMDSIKHTEYVRSSLRSSKILPGPTETLAASLHRGLQIIEYHKMNSSLDRPSVSFSFEHLAVKQSSEVDNNKVNAAMEQQSSDLASNSFLCQNCQKIETHTPTDEAKKDADTTSPTKRETELENVVKEQEAEIEKLNEQLKKYKLQEENDTAKSPTLLLENRNETCDLEVIKEECEGHMIQSIDGNDRETLLKEIASLRSNLHVQTDDKSTDRMIRSSLLAQSIQLRKSGVFGRSNSMEDIEKERERWTEMESEWICLTDELRIDLESERERAEKAEMQLRLEKKCTEELDDVLKRSVLGHARMVEHYADLQEKYNDLAERHRLVQEGVAELKRAIAKAGAKKNGGCHGSRFYKSLASELSNMRFERKKELDFLRKENISLKNQVRDTAEAVHAAGELLVRLKEAEETASVSEEKVRKMQEENEKLKKQIEKLKRKHKMEMITMKQYLAGSRLPESALHPLHREDSFVEDDNTENDEDQAWKAEFGAIYQEQPY